MNLLILLLVFVWSYDVVSAPWGDPLHVHNSFFFSFRYYSYAILNIYLKRYLFICVKFISESNFNIYDWLSLYGFAD